MVQVRHLVWDWNGTLLDDVAACVTAINCMLGRRNLELIGRDRYLDTFRFPVQGYYRTLGFNLEEEDWDLMAREFHADYDGAAKAAQLRPDAIETLDHIKSLGTPMSVLSASETGILMRMLERTKIDNYFKSVHGLSDLYGESKLALGRAMMADLAVDPASVVLVGDTIHDYEVACELGCRCILVTGGHQSESRLRTCDCVMVAALGDLPAYIVNGKTGTGGNGYE